MASIEFIAKRIEGKKKELAKLESKLERIQKAAATNWTVNPYYYSEYDMKWAIKDIAAAKEAIAEYEAQLDKENNKAASRNVPAITKFLDAWKARATEWYMKRKEAYPEALNEYRKAYYESEYYKHLNDWPWKRDNTEEWKLLDKGERVRTKAFKEKWGDIEELLNKACGFDKAVDTMLMNEYNAKYDRMLDEVIHITGTIADASELEIAPTGELNGFIKGEKGTAKILTYSAGGWNIQCFHFRTNITKVA